jgi:hypothetical protein
MGKRTIIECDCCHTESVDEELTLFTFKSPGKQKGRTYEICKKCASTIETQLVSNSVLSPGWTFNGGNTANVVASQTQAVSSETVTERRARLESAEPSADDLLIISKTEGKASLEAIEERSQERTVAGPATVSATDTKGKCLHYNKTPPMMGTVDGKKGFVHRCRDCGELLSLRSADERHSVSKIKDK